jgi:hypothetical protein
MLYIYRKTLVETITTTEIVKHKDWNDVKEDVSKIQSNSSKKLISELKVEHQI